MIEQETQFERPAFEVRDVYGGKGDFIEIEIPESWSDEQKVNLALSIHKKLGGTLSGMNDYQIYLIADNQLLRPGCWGIGFMRGKLAVMNVNASTVEEYNKRMLSAVEESISEIL